jgi:thiol-disulfide isomerase/thioredoxin
VNLARDVPIAALAMTLFERVHMPSFAGATEWLNSEPLGPAELRGRVVLVNFWTWTCINWLRQEPYVRAWSQGYRNDGLIVIGVHTPEFSFEHDIDGVRRGDGGASDRLPGSGRQRLRGLERVRQPFLAGALLRRRGRHHP